MVLLDHVYAATGKKKISIDHLNPRRRIGFIGTLKEIAHFKKTYGIPQTSVWPSRTRSKG